MSVKKKWCYLIVHPETKVKIDQEDLEYLQQFSWRVIYSSTNRPRVVTSFRGENGVRSITLGRFLMEPKKGKQVYPRRFQEGLDYRKDNLIICTLKERQRLLPKNRAASSSIYKGVSLVAASGKWRAGIEIEGKAMNLGNFETEEQAALIYNKASQKYFGEMGYQNIILRKKQKRK